MNGKIFHKVIGNSDIKNEKKHRERNNKWLRFLAAPLLSLSLNCSGIFLRDTAVNVKGSVSPIFGVSWDATFIGHFDERTREEVVNDLRNKRISNNEAREEAERVSRNDMKIKNNPELLKYLLSMLETKGGEENIKEALFWLGQYVYTNEDQKTRDEVIGKVIQFLSPEYDYKIRAHALLTLTKMRHAVLRYAINALFNKEQIIRFVGAYHLSQLATPKCVECIEALEKALQQENQPTVRREMEKALKNIKRNIKEK
jgi:hypothetical protein